MHPIDYANACPDVAITSLHYYFPWAMKALLRWSVFCTATGRAPMSHVDPAPWFTIADRTDLTYEEKLASYGALADDYFETERYRDFCASRLADLDEVAVEYFESPEFDQVLVETVTSTFPAHEHDQFVPHYRGLLAAWCRDERQRLADLTLRAPRTGRALPAPGPAPSPPGTARRSWGPAPARPR